MKDLQKDSIYGIPEKPIYNPSIRALQNTDPSNAEDIFNPLFLQIISNVHSVKNDVIHNDLVIKALQDAVNADIDCGGFFTSMLEVHMETPNSHQSMNEEGGTF